MKIKIAHKAEKQIGGFRVSLKVYKRCAEIAEKENVTVAEVMRSILEQIIDEIEV